MLWSITKNDQLTCAKIDFLSELGLEQGEEESDSWDSEVKTHLSI